MEVCGVPPPIALIFVPAEGTNIISDVAPMRDGALWKFTCKLEYKSSMPTPT
jgi:hypothetical protein